MNLDPTWIEAKFTSHTHALLPVQFAGLPCAMGQIIEIAVRHNLASTEHPYYQDQLGWTPDDTPRATRTGRQTASLPLSPAISM